MEENKKMRFIVEHEISYDDIADALCSAFDPACNAVGYWCEISGKRKPDMIRFPESGEVYDYMHWPLNEGGALFVKDIEEDEGKTYVLDSETIRAGLMIVAEKHPELWAALTLDCRNTDADEFIQICVHGEVLYS